MLNRKCLLLSICCLSAIALIIVSCKKEKTQKQKYTDSQLIGQWVYDKIKINGTEEAYGHNPDCDKDRFYFINREGQDHFYEEILHPKEHTNCAISQIGAYWRLQGESLMLKFGSQSFTYKILRLTDTNFDVSIRADYNRDGKVDNVELFSTRKPCDGDAFCQE